MNKDLKIHKISFVHRQWVMGNLYFKHLLKHHCYLRDKTEIIFCRNMGTVYRITATGVIEEGEFRETQNQWHLVQEGQRHLSMSLLLLLL